MRTITSLPKVSHIHHFLIEQHCTNLFVLYFFFSFLVITLHKIVYVILLSLEIITINDNINHENNVKISR